MGIQRGNDINRWLTAILLLVILAGGSYLRYVGLDWDVEQHLHPDERFLTMVESSLVPVPNLKDYFDTSSSTLNPNNQGHGFYVYGTLPIFMVRYLAEWLGYNGYGSVYLVGRSLSAAMDLLSVALVFFIGARLFNRKVGLLAAAFSSFAVLQIQQAHFFTVDTFATLFTLLAVYFAVEVVTAGEERINLSSYLLFGAALGMAVASKINAAPVAMTLPLAALLHWTGLSDEKKNQLAPRIALFLVLAALMSLVTFRIFQPYAFEGPGFINIGLNENWVSTLKSLRAQTSGDVDFPPALQWARRPAWFSLQNMVIWGMGIPYGILAWIGFGWMGWKIISKRSWKPELVLWCWTGFYFVWQSLQWNSTMRYQLPIYPLMGVFAGWLLIDLWTKLKTDPVKILGKETPSNPLRIILIAGSVAVLIFTAGWAFAFSRIYATPHPRVAATRWILQNIPGPANLKIETEDGIRQQLLTYPEGYLIQQGSDWVVSFDAKYDGQLEEIYFPEIINQNPSVNPQTLSISLNDQDGNILFNTDQVFSFTMGKTAGRVEIKAPIKLELGEIYQLRLVVNDQVGAVSLQGAGIANESSWDDGLPLRMDGYDPYGGIYKGGLNFEMYWDDNPEKLTRFISTLDLTDYIMITSSRQWATTTRVPERYPLTTEFYRQLMGCPLDLTIESCYNWALPGQYQGNLGFELVETFQSNPNLAGLEINDQPSEEAFTVYDHPKVFIFRKQADFDLTEVTGILAGVDLSRVIHLTPKQADNQPGDLMLPAARLAGQREGGTWSELFNPESLINRSQLVSVLVWYLTVFILGLLVYPLLRKILSGLNDYGYPLARTFGMLLFSYLVWLAGSTGIPVLRITTIGVMVILVLLGIYTGYLQREALLQEWNQKSKYFLIIEALALGLFFTALFIRVGNPDLWHPWKGGEKPMDFSYFNAVLKSTSFPPYDPWFAGGYINYYYYGFVFVGMLVKLLGIMPSLAYNLILPTLFMMLGLGAFSISWNLVRGLKGDSSIREHLSYLAGGSGVLGLLIFGNLGVLRMVFQGIQRLASAGVNVLEGNFFQRIKWTLLGLVQLFETKTLHYRMDEWYWNPSRAIGGEHGGPITEFPFFTFLYGDLHAHFIALPITVLALAWVLSVVLSRGKSGKRNRGLIDLLAVPLFGALVVGALRPTNTWDFYPYLALGTAALLFAMWQDFREDKTSWSRSALRIFIFLAFAMITFQPYSNWYGQGYTSIKPWFGTHTPVNDFLVHWGLFLFVIVTWMISETINWMATTPVSALSKLKKYRELILAAFLILLVIIISFGVTLENKVSIGEFNILGSGVHIIWFVLPLMVWTAILLFRPDQPLEKSVVLFLIGTSLAITLMVELVYVVGDIGRMNTVFKFYLEAWTFFAVSAAVCLTWMIDSVRKWRPSLKGFWQVIFYILVSSAALYPLLGGVAKIKDRMSMDAPHTLDGMAYMQTAVYHDLDTRLDLSQDYRAIRWMQDNIQGSPVIVEANQVEYHWATRYTVYTGLPGVVGWNWHQRQQRTLTPHEWVFSRVEAVNVFFDIPDLDYARDFLEKYQVSYIVVGQLERAKYSSGGIDKFLAGEGILWKEVYRDQETVIYQSLLEIE